MYIYQSLICIPWANSQSLLHRIQISNRKKTRHAMRKFGLRVFQVSESEQTNTQVSSLSFCAKGSIALFNLKLGEIRQKQYKYNNNNNNNSIQLLSHKTSLSMAASPSQTQPKYLPIFQRAPARLLPGNPLQGGLRVKLVNMETSKYQKVPLCGLQSL